VKIRSYLKNLVHEKPAVPFTSNALSDLKISDPVLNGVFTVLIKYYFIGDQLTYLKFSFKNLVVLRLASQILEYKNSTNFIAGLKNASDCLF